MRVSTIQNQTYFLHLVCGLSPLMFMPRIFAEMMQHRTGGQIKHLPTEEARLPAPSTRAKLPQRIHDFGGNCGGTTEPEPCHTHIRGHPWIPANMDVIGHHQVRPSLHVLNLQAKKEAKKTKETKESIDSATPATPLTLLAGSGLHYWRGSGRKSYLKKRYLNCEIRRWRGS